MSVTARNGYIDLIALLVTRFPEALAIVDRDGDTPLTSALQSSKPSTFDVVKLLVLECGEQPAAKFLVQSSFMCVCFAHLRFAD